MTLLLYRWSLYDYSPPHVTNLYSTVALHVLNIPRVSLMSQGLHHSWVCLLVPDRSLPCQQVRFPLYFQCTLFSLVATVNTNHSTEPEYPLILSCVPYLYHIHHTVALHYVCVCGCVFIHTFLAVLPLLSLLTWTPTLMYRWLALSKKGIQIFVRDIPNRFPRLAAKHFPKLPCPSYSAYQPIDTGLRSVVCSVGECRME